MSSSDHACAALTTRRRRWPCVGAVYIRPEGRRVAKHFAPWMPHLPFASGFGIQGESLCPGFILWILRVYLAVA